MDSFISQIRMKCVSFRNLTCNVHSPINIISISCNAMPLFHKNYVHHIYNMYVYIYIFHHTVNAISLSIFVIEL